MTYNKNTFPMLAPTKKTNNAIEGGGPNGRMVDPYSDKSLRFYDQGDHYDLWIVGNFHGIDDDDASNSKVDFIKFVQDIREADKSKEIVIYIASYGGYMDGLLILIPELLQFKHIVTVCTSQAASCGFILWALGQERYVSPYAELVYHEPSFGNICKIDEMNTMTTAIRERYNLLYKDLAIDQILTPEELEKGKTTEVYFSGKALIERGVAIPFECFYTRPKIPIAGFPIVGSYMFVERNDGTYVAMNIRKFMDEEFKKATITFNYGEIIDMLHISDIRGESPDKFIKSLLAPKKNATKKSQKSQTKTKTKTKNKKNAKKTDTTEAKS